VIDRQVHLDSVGAELATHDVGSGVVDEQVKPVVAVKELGDHPVDGRLVGQVSQEQLDGTVPGRLDDRVPSDTASLGVPSALTTAS
jgi:hypothetical protein